MPNPYTMDGAPEPSDKVEYGLFLLAAAQHNGGDWCYPPVLTANYEQLLNNVAALMKAGLYLGGERRDNETPDAILGHYLTGIAIVEAALDRRGSDSVLEPTSLAEAHALLPALAWIAANALHQAHPGNEKAALAELRGHVVKHHTREDEDQ